MSLTDKLFITTVKADEITYHEDTLVQQMTYTLLLNGEHSITSVCCPGDLKSLVYGYLATQGLIVKGENSLSFQQNRNVVNISLREESIKRELESVTSDFTVTPQMILSQVREFVKSGEIFKATGATHSSAISKEDSFVSYVEDISRSAVLEKVIGSAFLKNAEFSQSFIIMSSRVPSGFVRKIARVGIPIIAAISAPTLQAVKEAEQLGVCLCGFVRGNRMNVYSNKWRVGL